MCEKFDKLPEEEGWYIMLGDCGGSEPVYVKEVNGEFLVDPQRYRKTTIENWNKGDHSHLSYLYTGIKNKNA